MCNFSRGGSIFATRKSEARTELLVTYSCIKRYEKVNVVKVSRVSESLLHFLGRFLPGFIIGMLRIANWRLFGRLLWAGGAWD